MVTGVRLRQISIAQHSPIPKNTQVKVKFNYNGSIACYRCNRMSPLVVELELERERKPERKRKLEQ